MLRNVQPIKNGPPSTGERTTGPKVVRLHHSTLRRRKQPPPSEMKKRPLCRFTCSFCGKSRPESDLVGRDGVLAFCGRCVTALDALHDGADDALAIWEEPNSAAH